MLGIYRIIDQIGRGGFGAVYRAEHSLIQQKVAIKILTNFHGDPHANERFLREARALARLQHDNIVHVLNVDALPDSQGYYLVMELLEGQTLDQLLNGDEAPDTSHEPLSIPRVREITRQCCLALAYIHSQGIIHRDIKPANIFLRPDPITYDKVKLFDFGIAHVSEDDGVYTSMGTRMGSARYMSPEQFAGMLNRIDERSDLYSLAVVLFQMLTRRTPLEREDELLHPAYDDNTIPSLSQIMPGREWHPNLEQFLQTALARKPDERFSNARDFAHYGDLALAAQEELERDPDLELDVFLMVEQAIAQPPPDIDPHIESASSDRTIVQSESPSNSSHPQSSGYREEADNFIPVEPTVFLHSDSVTPPASSSSSSGHKARVRSATPPPQLAHHIESPESPEHHSATYIHNVRYPTEHDSAPDTIVNAAPLLLRKASSGLLASRRNQLLLSAAVLVLISLSVILFLAIRAKSQRQHKPLIFDTLQLETQPRRAAVNIDEQFRGHTPIVLTGRRGDTLRISIRLPGHRERSFPYTFHTPQDRLLLNLATKSTIIIGSKPTRARVLQQGKLLGCTPYRFIAQPDQLISLTLVCPGYYHRQLKLVMPQTNRRLNYKLKPGNPQYSLQDCGCR
jgi:serine/threonine protein kinase